MLADVVRERRNEVLEYARGRLAELTSARQRSEDDPGNYLPSLLDLIVADLAQPGLNADDDADLAASAADHGRACQRLGADVHAVVYDFGVICDGIAEIAGRSGVSIGAAEWQKLNRALDLGIAAAISSYEALRRDQERRAVAAELGSIAHELRNALAAASVAFEAVRRGHVGTNSRTADIVLRNLRQSAVLAGALAVQSKAQARPELTLAPVLLRPVVEDIVASATSADGITIAIDVAPSLGVVADKQLLVSALTNLVQNALKFTRPGGTVTVRAAATEGGPSIEVEDECGGLPAGETEALFGPFVQEGGDRTGAGLGLSIVRTIMIAHRGSVRARDLPGRGCIFELSFPRNVSV
jgi:hypothetical protein